ncbi:MAG: dihydropyrimidine dehydrogenase, partial [Candidatus Hodarchaeales archaeon]
MSEEREQRKQKLKKKRTHMSVQESHERIRNFTEVALGYTDEEAFEEASRCLKCKKPRCVKGCPVNVQIPEFIQKVLENDVNGAKDIILCTNSLPAITGRVCPQENQCQE